jgi:hypothetical protein
LADNAPVEREPLVASLPLQAPEAVQAVAFVDDHDRVELAPLDTVLGLALKVTVGAAAVTVTVVDWAALPPAPVQVTVYVVDAVSAPVDCEPLVASLPDQPPEAAQAVAFVVDQVKVELLPLAMELGLAARVTVGAGVGEVTDTVAAWVALPPAPVQLSV